MNIRNLLPKQQTTQGYIVCNSIQFVAISLCCYFGHFSFKYSRRKIHLEDFRSILFIYNNFAILFGILSFPFCCCCCCIILDSMKEEEKTRRNIKFFCCIKYIFIYKHIYSYIDLYISKPQILIQTDSPSKCFDQQNGRKTVKKGWGGLFTIHIRMLLVLANTKANN